MWFLNIGKIILMTNIAAVHGQTCAEQIKMILYSGPGLLEFWDFCWHWDYKRLNLVFVWHWSRTSVYKRLVILLSIQNQLKSVLNTSVSSSLKPLEVLSWIFEVTHLWFSLWFCLSRLCRWNHFVFTDQISNCDQNLRFPQTFPWREGFLSFTNK